MPDHVQMLDVEAMTDALLAAYEEAVEAQRIVVVTVESRTGWGKSDAVCRFFSYLREERDAFGYWPSDLEGGRHDLYPYRWSPEPGAVMPYLWWGLRGQLEHIGGGLVARPAALDGEWQLQILAGPVAEALDRYDERWRTRLRAALSVSGLVLSLFGDLPRLVEQALMVKDRYDQAQSWREAVGQVRDAMTANATDVQGAMLAPESRDPIRTDRPAQAAQAWPRAAEVLAKVSRVTPIVIAVEDAQLLDESTVALLRQVQRLDTVGLIVLTIAADRLAPEDHLASWLSTMTGHAPSYGVAGAQELRRYALSAFTVDELQQIARDRLIEENGTVHPGAGSGILRLAQAVGGSVLLLHQLLDLPAVSRALIDGQQPPLQDATLRAASADDGRRQAWAAFPPRQRRGLAVASTLGLVMPIKWLSELLTLLPGCADVTELEQTGWATAANDEFAIADAATKATLIELCSTELTGDEVAKLQGWLGDRIGERHQAGSWEELPLRIRLEALRAATTGAPLDERTGRFGVELVELQARTGQSVPYQRQALQYLLPAASDARLAATSVSVLAGGYLDIGERATAIALLKQRLTTLERNGSITEATLCRHDLARALQGDGQFGAAIEQLERVLAARRRAEPPNARQLDLVETDLYDCYETLGRWADALTLARTRYDTLRHDHQAADRATLEWGIRTYRACRQLDKVEESLQGFDTLLRDARSICPPTDHLAFQLRLERADSLGGRATYQARQEAIAHLEVLCADLHLAWGDDDDLLRFSRDRLADTYRDAGRLNEAIPLFEQTLNDQVAVLGNRHPHTLISRNNLASAYRQAGRLDEAIPLYEQTLTDQVAVLGDQHPETLTSRNNLASAYRQAGRLDEAIPLYEQTLTDLIAVLGDQHPHTLASRNNLASAYQDAGRLDEAIPLLEQTLTARVAVLGDKHPGILTSRNNLAGAYQQAGRPDQAIPLFEQTLTARVAVLGDKHPDTLISRNNLADAYRAAERLDQAIPLFEQTLTDFITVLGDKHPDTLTSRHNLAGAYWQAGRPDQAIPLLEQTLTDSIAVLGDQHPGTLTSRNNLAAAYQQAGRLDQAIPLFEQTLTDLIAVLGDQHPDTLTSRNNLANAYGGSGRLDEVIPLLEQTLTDRVAVLGDQHPHTLTSRDNLARVYRDAGRLDEASAVERSSD